MVYVFVVDNGTMVQLAMDLALGTVKQLKKAIEVRCRIQYSSQVLLVSGGQTLDEDERVCKYNAGTDTNPIFLFTLQKLNTSDASTPPPSPNTSNTPNVPFSPQQMSSKVEEVNRLSDSKSTLAMRCSLAQSFVRLASQEVHKCQTAIHDQHMQNQGWHAAVANIEDATSLLTRKMFSLVSHYEQHLKERTMRQELIESFDDDVAILHQLPIFHSLVIDENSKEFVIDGSSELNTSDVSFESNLSSPPNATAAKTSNEDLENGTPNTLVASNMKENDNNPAQISSNLTLLRWIQKHSDHQQSIEQVADSCYRSIEKFNEQLYEELKSHVEQAVLAANQEDMKEVRGLSERLQGLEQLLMEAKRLSHEQSELGQAFLNNQQRAHGINDDSILPDLCASHRFQLGVMVSNYSKIVSIRQRIEKAKDELCVNLNLRLKWVVYVQRQISTVGQTIVMYEEQLRRLTSRLFIIKQLHAAPSLYVWAVAETVRRQKFSSLYSFHLRNLHQKLNSIYERELQHRRSFSKRMSPHFLSRLFNGLNDYPPSPFDSQSQKFDFDTKLPDLSVDQFRTVEKTYNQIVGAISSSATNNNNSSFESARKHLMIGGRGGKSLHIEIDIDKDLMSLTTALSRRGRRAKSRDVLMPIQPSNQLTTTSPTPDTPSFKRSLFKVGGKTRLHSSSVFNVNRKRFSSHDIMNQKMHQGINNKHGSRTRRGRRKSDYDSESSEDGDVSSFNFSVEKSHVFKSFNTLKHVSISLRTELNSLKDNVKVVFNDQKTEFNVLKNAIDNLNNDRVTKIRELNDEKIRMKCEYETLKQKLAEVETKYESLAIEHENLLFDSARKCKEITESAERMECERNSALFHTKYEMGRREEEYHSMLKRERGIWEKELDGRVRNLMEKSNSTEKVKDSPNRVDQILEGLNSHYQSLLSEAEERWRDKCKTEVELVRSRYKVLSSKTSKVHFTRGSFESPPHCSKFMDDLSFNPSHISTSLRAEPFSTCSPQQHISTGNNSPTRRIPHSPSLTAFHSPNSFSSNSILLSNPNPLSMSSDNRRLIGQPNEGNNSSFINGIPIESNAFSYSTSVDSVKNAFAFISHSEVEGVECSTQTTVEEGVEIEEGTTDKEQKRLRKLSPPISRSNSPSTGLQRQTSMGNSIFVLGGSSHSHLAHGCLMTLSSRDECRDVSSPIPSNNKLHGSISTSVFSSSYSTYDDVVCDLTAMIEVARKLSLGKGIDDEERLMNLLADSQIKVFSPFDVGDRVLVVWNVRHGHHVLLNMREGQLHFVHADSVSNLGLIKASSLNDSSKHSDPVIAVLTNKEFCQAKKADNRFKVELGKKFYRVKCRKSSASLAAILN